MSKRSDDDDDDILTGERGQWGEPPEMAGEFDDDDDE